MTKPPVTSLEHVTWGLRSLLDAAKYFHLATVVDPQTKPAVAWEAERKVGDLIKLAEEWQADLLAREARR